MKFIPGTKFINRTKSNTKFFKPGKLYVLHNIKGCGKYIEYEFKVDKEINSVKFESAEQADEWLEKIKI